MGLVISIIKSYFVSSFLKRSTLVEGSHDILGYHALLLHLKYILMATVFNRFEKLMCVHHLRMKLKRFLIRTGIVYFLK